ncbi:MAG: NAD(P)-dependent oxidoreductase, partial [Paracoccaceae bacterium]
MQVFSTHPLHPQVTARLTAASDYRVASTPTAAAIMAEGLAADVLIVRANIPSDYFALAPHLRAAVRHGAGLDMIPMRAATAAGVLVANVPGANAQTVAEHVIFAAIALLRQFRAMDAALRSQGWTAGRAFSDHGRDLGGRTLGIFGYGNIGRALHRLAQGFGMKITSHTRSPQNLPPDVQALSLDDLAATSDILVLCAPL